MDKTFTYQELQKYNGKDGNPAYVSYKGTVYDVTESDLWKNGRHQNLHDAGDDMSLLIDQAPHGVEVFERELVKEVGKLV
ncbi:cytochrome B5 [candidate division LCP-89 bacterium B3_LCP]|uniref:Cytochrome B5 n=1 Tax=candidate division LCP-89 bacterium B3_LCP TaxID=2012998 RepID=A0A532UZI0_UNCL8|nr:MAG: cytochrome B5 [candidate division LCP-89 bacterium B3_LCP]